MLERNTIIVCMMQRNPKPFLTQRVRATHGTHTVWQVSECESVKIRFSMVRPCFKLVRIGS